MTAPSVAKMMEIAHIGANEISSGGKVQDILVSCMLSPCLVFVFFIVWYI